MKKTGRIILIVLLLFILGGIGGGSAYIGNEIANTAIQLSTTDGLEKIPYDYLKEEGVDYDSFVEKYQVERIDIRSSYDHHNIPADFISSKKTGKKEKTVIMVHGLGGNKFTVYPVAEFFLEDGYNVLAFDQRSSGENTAKYTTGGYLEKYDLSDAIDYVIEQGAGESIGLWGESMGGATICAALKYQSIERKVDFVVLDSPLSSMQDMVSATLDEMDLPIPTKYMLFCGDIMNRLKYGFSYKQCEGAINIEHTDVPLLVIHSEADELTPSYMGKDIYEASQSEQKYILTVADSAHCEIWKDHREEYEEALEKVMNPEPVIEEVSEAETEETTEEYQEELEEETEEIEE